MDITDIFGEPPEGVYTRRNFLRFAGGTASVMGAGSLLAACGGSSSGASSSGASSSGASSTGTATAHVGGPLNIFTWQGYDLTKPLASWRKQHQINQTVKYLSNQFDVAALLKGPNGKQYDSSTANQAYTSLFQSFGIMHPITVRDVPSMANLYPFFRQSPIWRWSGTSTTQWNSVPWTWGALGINWLTDRVPKPTSYNVLIDPRNKGRVGTFDDGYNNVSVAAVALGLDLTHITPAQLNGPIKQWLLKLKANVKTFSPSLADQVTLLVNKEVDYMQIGNSEFVVFAQQQGAKDVGFTVPKEGGFGFTDAAFVTPWAPNKANAFAFCEALIAPKTAAAAANNLTQSTTNPLAVPYLNAVSKSLVPYDNVQTYVTQKLKLEVNYNPKSGEDIVNFQDINNLWSKIKAA
jgi:spermidine/putrescine transport system substrate-binding protein